MPDADPTTPDRSKRNPSAKLSRAAKVKRSPEVKRTAKATRTPKVRPPAISNPPAGEEAQPRVIQPPEGNPQTELNRRLSVLATNASNETMAPPAPDDGPEPSEASGPNLSDLLKLFKDGDRVAGEELFGVLTSLLRKIASHLMRDQRKGHTLGVTGLVGEALLKLLGYDRKKWPDTIQPVLQILANAMRQVLVDYARSRNRDKRGGGAERRFIEEALSNIQVHHCDITELDEALAKLAEVDQRAATIVDLKFFIGLNWPEIAKVLQISESTAMRDWTFAQAWLKRALE